MNNAQVIWLASYPRSGNTLLRTILYQCFGLQSASLYPNDLGGNKELHSYVGHVEYKTDNKDRASRGGLVLIKTHEPPSDDMAAIYVVRDGRAACVSLWEFDRKKLSLEELISGGHRMGTWADHILKWQPLERSNTLVLKYEDMTDNLSGVLKCISQFLDREAISDRLPSREEIAKVDGRWVRMESNWRKFVTAEHLDLFSAINGHMMKKMGYDLD